MERIPNGRYTKEFREEAVKMATEGGLSVLETSKRLSLPKSTLVRSLSRFSEKVLLIISGKSDVRADVKKIGPALICERLWKELEIGKIIRRLLAERKFGFDVERAIFLTDLRRFGPGDDQRRDDGLPGRGEDPLHPGRPAEEEQRGEGGGPLPGRSIPRGSP
jgi:transposase-like protein